VPCHLPLVLLTDRAPRTDGPGYPFGSSVTRLGRTLTSGMITSITFTAFLWLLMPVPISAAAQAPGDSAGREAAIEKLLEGQLVRLAGADLGRREGRLLERGATELVLASDSGPLQASSNRWAWSSSPGSTPRRRYISRSAPRSFDTSGPTTAASAPEPLPALMRRPW
jgi:hypothetical protein